MFAMPKKEHYLSIRALGEWYQDLLTIDAWINNRTNSLQANTLLSAKLQEREERIKERVGYLAKKRGISAEDLWQQILRGEASRPSSDGIELIEAED